MIEKALDSHAKKYETHENELAKEKEALPKMSSVVNREAKFVKRKR